MKNDLQLSRSSISWKQSYWKQVAGKSSSRKLRQNFSHQSYWSKFVQFATQKHRQEITLTYNCYSNKVIKAEAQLRF